MKKSKVLVIGPTPPPYHGVSVVTEMILNSNLQKRFRIVHLDIADRRTLSNIGTIDFTNIYLTFKFFFCFLKLCLSENPKIVYLPISQGIWGYLRDCLFLIPAKLFQRKVIIHLHGGYFREFYEKSNKILKMIIKWTLKDVQRAIVLGQRLKYIFHGLIPDDRITVLPNGIKREFIEKLKGNFQNQKLKPNISSILFLGSLLKTKGLMDLIQAVSLVVTKRKNVNFVFAGEMRSNKEKKEVEGFINRNGIQSFIKFPGVVTGERKARLILSSDIFILPSHSEGQPLTVLEAMAAGLPVITTNVGVLTETVIDCENGFIVEKKNPREIAEKILLLLEDEKLRIKMGKKSHERFLKYYTKNKFIGKLGQVFEEVLLEAL